MPLTWWKRLRSLFNSSCVRRPDGIYLDLRKPVWRVSGLRDLPAFLRALASLLPEDAVLYLEGGVADEEIRVFFAQRSRAEQSRVMRGTYGKPECVHVPATADNLDELARIAEHHAEPEIAIHIVAYVDGQVLLSWYDAFGGPLYLSRSIAEERVEAFCTALGAEYSAEGD